MADIFLVRLDKLVPEDFALGSLQIAELACPKGGRLSIEVHSVCMWEWREKCILHLLGHLYSIPWIDTCINGPGLASPILRDGNTETSKEHGRIAAADRTRSYQKA